MRYLEYAHSLRPLKKIVLGADFFAFNAYRPKSRSDFNGDRLEATGGVAALRARMNDAISIVLSASAVTASIDTIKEQEKGALSNVFVDGRRIWKDEYITYKGGHRKLFNSTERGYLRNVWFPPPRKTYSLVHESTGYSPMHYYRSMLDFARRENIDLRIFISPIHARMLEAMNEAGLWDEFEQWKRELVRVTDEEARSRPGSPPFPLWDFSGYNSITTEKVPPGGDAAARMKWYIEGSHYRVETGDLVLDRVYGHTEPGRTVPDDFGVLLDMDNMEAHLARIRQAGAGYRRVNADDLKEIAGLAREIGVKE